MGRPRKPRTLKILDGDQPCRIEPPTPGVAPGIGEPPEWLDAIGKSTWARLARLFEPMGLAGRPDSELLTLYCVAYSRWWRALAVLEDEGFTVETKTTTKVHPAVSIANEAQKTLGRILGKFGMSPSDRAGLHVRERPEDDGLLRFLASKPTDAKPARGRKKAH